MFQNIKRLAIFAPRKRGKERGRQGERLYVGAGAWLKKINI